MRLVDDEEGDPIADRSEDPFKEPLVSQPFGRDEQNVDLAPLNGVLDALPVSSILGVDRLRFEAQSVGRSDLVPYQGKKRRHEKCRAHSGLSQELDGNEVDEALAPAGALNNQQPSPTFDDVPNRLLLAASERCLRQSSSAPEQVQRPSAVVVQTSPVPAMDRWARLSRTFSFTIRVTAAAP